MRLSVRAARSARPELFVNYISGSFIAPEPRATEKPPPPPQTASRAPGAPASRRPSCNDSTGPEVSVSPTRDVEPERVAGTPAQEGRGRRAGQVPPATALSPREAWTNFADLVALARTVSVEQLPGGSSGVFAEIDKRFWQCPEKDGSKTQRGTFHMLWESPWSEEARAAFTRPRDQPSLLDLFFLKRLSCGA
ncbi:uncharacterized protein LOC117068065 isoform X3 [Trachypithecus francoisi]|uniref:uncharacterized protein LOC117068065 isoform X3 n=1 Tax=Trachypithecus francoisi TaxID=54180 RepID=UPI00141A71F6|nr:uncharacterized protein LOC117068065 isoform X3 [Trachypithecus francoisi]